uniref:Uncharacterized protein n=1 Tax=Scophthalmus maximus TaxID=52904 RepID=A0A8D3BUW6_SCOMX
MFHLNNCTSLNILCFLRSQDASTAPRSRDLSTPSEYSSNQTLNAQFYILSGLARRIHGLQKEDDETCHEQRRSPPALVRLPQVRTTLHWCLGLPLPQASTKAPSLPPLSLALHSYHASPDGRCCYAPEDQKVGRETSS